MIEHLTQTQLAKRWGLSARSLERWRWQGVGPAYLRIGGRVRYELSDVEAFELSNRKLDRSADQPDDQGRRP